MSNSEEEEIARNYICFGNPDVTIVIVDATSLERNLNLVYQTMEITNNIIVCVNLLDEAKKKGIEIDLDSLSKLLGVPVVGTIARKKKTLKTLLDTIYKVCSGKIIPEPKMPVYPDFIEESIALLLPHVSKILPKKYKYISRWICLKLIDGDKKILSSIKTSLSKDFMTKTIKKELDVINVYIDNNTFRDKIVSTIVFNAETICNDVCFFKDVNYNERDRKIDKVLTSKTFGIPIMLLFLGFVFWLTITGANYPSSLLSKWFGMLQNKLLVLFNYIHSPWWLTDMLVNGVYQTLAWVVSVMLPPMAIFFPLFTILEDLGFLPRVSFNLDKLFKKACTSRETSINYVHGLWL